MSSVIYYWFTYVNSTGIRVSMLSVPEQTRVDHHKFVYAYHINCCLPLRCKNRISKSDRKLEVRETVCFSTFKPVDFVCINVHNICTAISVYLHVLVWIIIPLKLYPTCLFLYLIFIVSWYLYLVGLIGLPWYWTNASKLTSLWIPFVFLTFESSASVDHMSSQYIVYCT